MKALRNLRKLFKNRRNQVKADSIPAKSEFSNRPTKTQLKVKKGERTWAMKPNGKRKGQDLHAHGGCRVPGGRTMDWEEHRKYNGKPKRIARLTLPELVIKAV